MSTTTKTTSGNSMLKLVLLTIAFIIFIFAISSSFKSCKSDKKQKEDRTESVNDGNTNLSNTYTETYTLKQGEVVRVFIPTWYKYEIYSGDKKFYYQDQNSQKVLVGDGSTHDAGHHIAYFDLSYYDEEITIVVEFKRLR